MDRVLRAKHMINLFTNEYKNVLFSQHYAVTKFIGAEGSVLGFPFVSENNELTKYQLLSCRQFAKVCNFILDFHMNRLLELSLYSWVTTRIIIIYYDFPKSLIYEVDPPQWIHELEDVMNIFYAP